MPPVSTREAIALLRSQGYTDQGIALLFQASGIPLPEGNYLRWSVPAIREGVMGEDPSGMLVSGHRGGHR